MTNLSENIKNVHKIENCIFARFHYKDDDDLLVKFEPTREFNLMIIQ